jgi:hypothetical protein
LRPTTPETDYLDKITQQAAVVDHPMENPTSNSESRTARTASSRAGMSFMAPVHERKRRFEPQNGVHLPGQIQNHPELHLFRGVISRVQTTGRRVLARACSALKHKPVRRFVPSIGGGRDQAPERFKKTFIGHENHLPFSESPLINRFNCMQLEIYTIA